MQYKKELMKELETTARLYHASDLLPYKLLDVLDKHLPNIAGICCERGCVEWDNFSTLEENEFGSDNYHAIRKQG